MEIDPRLRSDTSSGSQYPPLHRGSSSSAPPALAPNPAHLSLTHQYQVGHDGPHQSIYPPPHTPSSTSPGDRPRSAHDGTPEDGGTNDPKRPRACEACRGLKVRCELDINNPSGPCKRCTKANRNCVVTVPSRKRQKKTDSRVAELEKKIDALTASLHASKSGTISTEHGSETEVDHDTPNGGGRTNHYEQVTNGGYGVTFDTRQGSDSWTPPERFRKPSETDGRPVPPPMVIAGQKRKHHDGHTNVGSTPTSQNTSPSDQRTRSTILHPFMYGEFPEDAPTQRPNPSNQYADVIDRGILNMERATKMFNRYTIDMAPQLPAVIFPPGTTAADIRKSKPTLFLAVLCAGSGTDHPEIQRVLTKEVMQIYADRIICHGEKTLELVQALLVSTIWYWPPEHFEELKFYQLIHIAAVMGLDINIGKKDKAPKSKMGGHGLWRDHPWRRAPFPDKDTFEAKRAWLGCYFMCSATSMGLRRPNLIRWSPYMAECVEVLESSPDAASTDKFLCQWVRNQRIAEEVSVQFQMDDPCAVVNIADPKVQYALKGFERDLEHWSEQVPKDLRTRMCEFLDLLRHKSFL
jgi:Fungal Zn(2)-Cys(6) binuclear cluster domain